MLLKILTNEIEWHFREANTVYFGKLELTLEKNTGVRVSRNIRWMSQCDN